MNARILLEDGFVLEGKAFGAPIERTGEVIFNTSMTGYQEILTDPSYAGQIVIMTYPHIGNYGITPEDDEAVRPFVQGFVAREFSAEPSNWRSRETLNDYLIRHSVPGIMGIDTRALVRRIRSIGAMRGMITCSDEPTEALLEKIRLSSPMIGLDLVKIVSRKDVGTFETTGQNNNSVYHIVAYDFGIKKNIIRSLTSTGFRVTVVPCSTSADDVMTLKPDGIFLSNGPGDPAAVRYGIEHTRALIGRIPIFGICLGHQILALALGAKTYKMKFGHRGGNQPVKNLLTGKVEITSHNHGFAVDPDSLNLNEIEITHINLNDQTLEGFRLKDKPAFCVQYHPEAAPGPHDSEYLFRDFYELVYKWKTENHKVR